MSRAPKPYWPLAHCSMTTLDKLKIGYWLLTNDQWTQGATVRAYEQEWEVYTGAPHVIMVSNGSMANELIALRRKWELQKAGEWPTRNKVVFPVVNWISSVSPWINLGFEPVFMDVGANLTSTPEQVAAALETRADIAAVFYTSLLGFTGGVESVLSVCRAANVPLYLDNCEASFTSEMFLNARDGIGYPTSRHISNVVTSSTSLYASHHTSGTQEGGLIFCQSTEEADWYRMARNHGMTRGMDPKYRNLDVDPMFDFYLMGSNYRSTNLLAYMASLDLERAIEFGYDRRLLSERFSIGLDDARYERPHLDLGGAVPLSIPIVTKVPRLIKKVKALLMANGIESRPIVSGNLLYQTAFRQYGDPKAFPRADYIHQNGLYVGLHPKVTEEMIDTLIYRLNAL